MFELLIFTLSNPSFTDINWIYVFKVYGPKCWIICFQLNVSQYDISKKGKLYETTQSYNTENINLRVGTWILFPKQHYIFFLTTNKDLSRMVLTQEDKT